MLVNLLNRANSDVAAAHGLKDPDDLMAGIPKTVGTSKPAVLKAKKRGIARAEAGLDNRITHRLGGCESESNSDHDHDRFEGLSSADEAEDGGEDESLDNTPLISSSKDIRTWKSASYRKWSLQEQESVDNGLANLQLLCLVLGP